MKQLTLNIRTFGMAVATRAMLGAGVGLLVSERIPLERRRRIGVALVTLGAATTILVVRAVLHGTR